MIVMFRKVLIAVAMLTGLMGTVASAKHHSQFNFGEDCGVWLDQTCFGHRGLYQWREDELGFRTSCAEARDIVRERGYRNVRISTCGVRVHGFTGLRHGHRYLIKVNGYNGDIWSIRRID
jgi:hypothetical protein